MKLKHLSFALAGLVSSTGLIACSADSNTSIPSASRTMAAVSYSSPTALPVCDDSTNFQIAFISDLGRFVVCHEGAWRELNVGATGETGAKGAQGPKGSRGVQGPKGQAGANGLNGIDGINGKDGADGKNGTDGANGSDGANGEDGKAGHSALVRMEDEPAGDHCKNGGVAITVGIDANDNGKLDACEGKTSYVCNGKNADAPLPPVPVCMPLGMMCMSSAECCSGFCAIGSSSIITPTSIPMPMFGSCQMIVEPQPELPVPPVEIPVETTPEPEPMECVYNTSCSSNADCCLAAQCENGRCQPW